MGGGLEGGGLVVGGEVDEVELEEDEGAVAAVVEGVGLRVRVMLEGL